MVVIGTFRVWLRAAAALVVIATLAVGVPWLLMATVANPLPEEGWSWSQPLTDTALLGLLAVLAWLFWAQMLVCLVIEVVAEIRLAAGRSADWMNSIPGTFGGQQHLARVLVQAVIAVGIGAGLAAGPAMTGGPGAAAVNGVEPVADQPQVHSSPIADADHHKPSPAATGTDHGLRSTRTVTVTRGDTLWALAERHLGSGEHWRRIADLNEGRLMVDGERFGAASSIQPSWSLLVPAHGSASDSLGGVRDAGVTVVPGDTLSGFAEEEYGHGAQWRRIYEANRDQIVDPDLIYPGQVLEIPAEIGTQPAAPVMEPEQPPAPHHSDSAPPVLPDSAQPASQVPSEVPTIPAPSTGTSTSESSEGPSSSRADSSTDEKDGENNVMSALLGGGGLLAGGALVMLLAHRRRQFRLRRSGRTIAHTPQHLVGAEATVRSAGSAGGVAASFLDQALRDMAFRLAQSGQTLPEVVAVRLADDRLDLMLATPAAGEPPANWTDDGTGQRWSMPRGAPLEANGALAPYPALVAIGVDEEGATWLLDLEAAGLLQLLGDRTACIDLARFIAAELAMNVWSDDADVTVAGFAAELADLNPARLRHEDAPDVADLVKVVRRVREATDAMGCDVLGGRLDGRGADSWMPKILVADVGSGSEHFREDVERLLDELAVRCGRHAVALVSLGDEPSVSGGTTLALDRDRHFTLMPWDAHLTANRLTAIDAQTLADLLTASDDADDEPMPSASGAQPFEGVSDAAGAFRPELTEARDGGDAPDSLLTLPDQKYVTLAATTPADLAALAPVVPGQTRARVIALDETLDDDLAAWYDPDAHRPRLRLLGPVELRASGERTADVDRRCAYFTEVVAYLATRDHGATPEQVADAFNVQTNTIHSRVGTVRKWLGTDPSTGNWYLPESTLSPSAKARGVPVYEVIGLLSDADLFKRLRVRGQARGQEGVDDLVAGLLLAEGRPFDQLRPGGYGWLAETPMDQYLTAGVVDVAHIVATHALASGDVERARWASETAIAAAPSEDKPRLDLAAVMVAQGRAREAGEHLAASVFNRSDDSGPPPSPSDRTEEVLKARGCLHGVQ